MLSLKRAATIQTRANRFWMQSRNWFARACSKNAGAIFTRLPFRDAPHSVIDEEPRRYPANDRSAGRHSAAERAVHQLLYSQDVLSMRTVQQPQCEASDA